MKKQTNIDFLFLVMLIAVVFAGATLIVQRTFAQTKDKIKYNAVYDCGEGKLKIKVLSCDGQSGDADCQVFFINKYSPGGGSTQKLQRSYVQDNFLVQCPVEGGNINQDATPDNKKDNQTPDTATEDVKDAKSNASQFKIGDRVQVSISGLKGDKYLQPCTITRELKDNGYNVKCDPWNTLSYMDYNVQPGWIQLWANATDAPQFDCSFDAPAGMVSKTSPASAELFKRVIYENHAAVEKAKLGLQFTIFQMGAPFKNVLTGGGLLKDMVPQNAIIYPVKTVYRTCTEGTSNEKYNYLLVTKENFGCYKDRFGDWVCGADSTPEFLERQSVPKKQ